MSPRRPASPITVSYTHLDVYKRQGYVCGAATRPAYRGAGIMAAMLQAAHSQMRRAGDAGAVLIPASQSLYAYYEKHGYRDFFYQDTLLLTDSPPDTVPARLAPLTDAGPVLPLSLIHI